MRRAALLVGLALLGPGCGYISFQKPPTEDELRLKAEVKEYYDRVALAFATANAEALTNLFSSDIAHPMTREQIHDWATKFFAENGPSHFKLRKIEFEELSFVRASVVIDYAVETKGARGDFHGAERDELRQRDGHWFVKAWDKLR